MKKSERLKSLNEKYLRTINRLREAKEEYINVERDEELKKLQKKWEEDQKKAIKNKEIKDQRILNFNEMTVRTKKFFNRQKSNFVENKRVNLFV
jgi:hypothetical protein